MSKVPRAASTHVVRATASQAASGRVEVVVVGAELDVVLEEEVVVEDEAVVAVLDDVEVDVVVLVLVGDEETGLKNQAMPVAK